MRTIVLAGLFAAAVLPAQAADLTIAIKGAIPSAGQVMVAVFDRAAGFSGAHHENAAAAMALPAGTTEISLRGLAPGEYAIKAFQDLNGDRVLNVPPQGRPAEPVAVSGRPGAGWPDFERAAVRVDADTRITLELAQP